MMDRSHSEPLKHNLAELGLADIRYNGMAAAYKLGSSLINRSEGESIFTFTVISRRASEWTLVKG